MKRKYIPFISFFILLLLSISIEQDVAISLVPGWRMRVFPPYFIATIILVLVTAGYWFLIKRLQKINWVFFLIHLMTTIPTVVFIRVLCVYVFLLWLDNGEDPMHQMVFLNKLIPLAFVLFLAGQVSFLIYFMKAISKNRLR
jgi:hypothetical protein